MTPGYASCRKSGCTGEIKHGKRVCLRCGTPVAETRPASRPIPRKGWDTSKVTLTRAWR